MFDEQFDRDWERATKKKRVQKLLENAFRVDEKLFDKMRPDAKKPSMDEMVRESLRCVVAVGRRGRGFETHMAWWTARTDCWYQWCAPEACPDPVRHLRHVCRDGLCTRHVQYSGNAAGRLTCIVDSQHHNTGAILLWLFSAECLQGVYGAVPHSGA